MTTTISYDELPSSQSDLLVSADFETVHSAVLETERGRWFLSEYSRRQRAVETAEIQTSLDRLMRRVIAYESFLGQLLNARDLQGRSSIDLPEVGQSRSPPTFEPAPKPAARGDLGVRLAALKEIDALDVEGKLKIFA